MYNSKSTHVYYGIFTVLRLLPGLIITVFFLASCTGANRVKATSAPKLSAPPSASTTKPQKPIEPPQWYQSKQRQQPGLIMGYGSDKSYPKARQKALADIAWQIDINISSLFICKQTQQQNTMKEDSCTDTTQSRSSQQLQAVQVLHETYLKEKDLHYIALVYDKRTLLQKAAVLLKKQPKLCIQKPKSILQQHTFFAQNLARLSGCRPDWHLAFRQGKAYLIMAQKQWPIAPQTLPQFWPLVQSEKLAIQMPRQTVQGTPFFITLVSKQAGWLSLFTIEENGIVQLLLANKRLKAQQQWSYPDKQRYDGLQTWLRGNQNSTEDLYLAMLCPQQQNLQAFSPVDRSQNTANRRDYLLQSLYQLDNRCIFSTHKLRTDKNHYE